MQLSGVLQLNARLTSWPIIARNAKCGWRSSPRPCNGVSEMFDKMVDPEKRSERIDRALWYQNEKAMNLRSRQWAWLAILGTALVVWLLRSIGVGI